jgi:hypothetical protein
MFMHVGYYPCDVLLFKTFIPEFREIFKIKDVYVNEARER